MEALKLKNTQKQPSLQLLENEHKQQEYLAGPVLDVLLMGGLSIIFFVAMHLLVDSSASTSKIGWVMFYASFVINFPHFMSSYLLLYGNYRKEILTNIKFTWAGIIAPIALISALGFVTYYSLEKFNPSYMGYAANLMFFLVGHHYVKQIYGCVMVSSAKKKFYFNKTESRALWFTMYSVWGMSFFSANSYAVNHHDLYGITYATLGLDVMWLNASYWITALAATSFVGLMVKRYVNDGKIMPLSAWTAIVTIFAWYIPTFYHQHYFYMIPFFHSLQYLLFTNVFVKNKASVEAGQMAKSDSERRAIFVKKVATFFGLAFVTGFLAWDYVPNLLDKSIETSPLLGATVFMFCFQIFLNIHHYIIDNVIWRKDNALMKKYL